MKARAIAILACSLVAMCGCKREERAFRVSAPDAARAESKELSPLQPGPVIPHPPVKNDYEQNAQAMSQGKQLFKSFNCNGCHANGGGDIGPPLMDAKWIYGHQPEQIFATIVEGRPNGMPSFRGHLTNEQTWQLVAYVRSLSGQTSPNAAPNRSENMSGQPPAASMEKQNPGSSTLPKSAEMPQ